MVMYTIIIISSYMSTHTSLQHALESSCKHTVIYSNILDDPAVIAWLHVYTITRFCCYLSDTEVFDYTFVEKNTFISSFMFSST